MSYSAIQLSCPVLRITNYQLPITNKKKTPTCQHDENFCLEPRWFMMGLRRDASGYPQKGFAQQHLLHSIPW